jgi:hypothetical protein
MTISYTDTNISGTCTNQETEPAEPDTPYKAQKSEKVPKKNM